MSTTLTGKNQVTIPAAIVKEMQLEPGTKLEWSVGDVPGIIIIKVEPTLRQRIVRLQELGAKMRLEQGPAWDPVGELLAERELDLQREQQEGAGLYARLQPQGALRQPTLEVRTESATESNAR
jgi:bifunctional DNA-binding transcriptional regulator/antitoxin component of YhaV-PrlF toxin-antitoxin module